MVGPNSSSSSGGMSGSLRCGEYVMRLSCSSLINPHVHAKYAASPAAKKNPLAPPPNPTSYALVYYRLNPRVHWTPSGRTAPAKDAASPEFEEEFSIPYDLRQHPQVRVEIFDMIEEAAGPDELPSQFFMGAAEFDLSEVIAKNYAELTHRLENDLDPMLSGSNSGRCGMVSVLTMDIQASSASTSDGVKSLYLKSGESSKNKKYLISSDAYELRLPDRDTVAPSPFVVYFTKRQKDEKWKVLGRTRTVPGEKAPKFVDQFPIVMFSEDGLVRVEVYNLVTVSDNLLDQQFIGATEVPVRKLIDAPGMKGRLALVNSLVKDINPGEVTLRLEYIDTSKSKIYFDVESGGIRKKGFGGGTKARLAYRLSVMEKSNWLQIFETPFRTSGENASDSSPAVRITATLNSDGIVGDTLESDTLSKGTSGAFSEENAPTVGQLGSIRSDIRWERAAYRVDEGPGAKFKIEFIHQKKAGANFEFVGSTEMTLAELRGISVGEHLPVVLDSIVVGRLLMKHQEKSDLSRYFSVQLVYGESAKFKGEEQ